MEVYPDIDKTQLFAILKQCMEERKSSFIENEFTYPDGSKGWFELSIQPVPEGLFILSNDITERKKAEEKLQMQIAELKTWHSVTLDREDRIIELKKEVNELLKVMNRSPRYDVDGDDRKGVS